MSVKKHYLFTLDKDRVIKTHITDRAFISKWGSLNREGQLTIRKGYSWDGATPRFIISIPKWNFWTTFGTWNGPKDENGIPLLYDCTLAHDFANQHLTKIINYKEWHQLMTFCMKKKKFIFRHIYSFAIYTFGWIWWLRNKRFK